MNIHDCELVQDRIAPYIEGLLSSEEANRVQAHLAVCPECKRIYSELQQVPQMLRDWQPEPPSAQMWSQITMKLGPRLTHTHIHRTRHRKRWLWGGAMAAAAMIVLLVGYWMTAPPVPINNDLTYDVAFYTAADKKIRHEAAQQCKDPSKPTQLEQLTELEKKDFTHFEPPKGYRVFYSGKIKCPCDNPHEALFTLYGGEMPFTMLLLSEKCPESHKVLVDGRCHVKRTEDGRIILAYRHPCDRTVVIIGKISIRDAARLAVGVRHNP